MGLVGYPRYQLGRPRPPVVVQAATASYDPDAAAAFARMVPEPSAPQKNRINNFILAWKASGKWATDDALWLHASHSAQAALINLKGNAAYDCVPVLDPVFRTYAGYMPDGSSSYLSTGFDPSVAVAPNFVRNSGSLWVRSNTDNSASGSLAGFFNSSGTTINPRNGAGGNYRVNCTGAVSSVNASAVGMFIANRTGSANTQFYIDGVLATSGTQASLAPIAGTFRLGSISNTSYRNCEFAAGGIGAGFVSDAQAAACASALNTYLNALRTEEGVTIA